MSQFDGFGDIINRSDGIFGASEPNIAGQDGGLKAHDSVRTQATQHGVAVEMQCRGCPRPLRLTVEYPELVAIKYNVPPQEVARYAAAQRLPPVLQEVTEWRYSQQQQAWWPVQTCSGCRNIVGPMFTPEEADELLRKARRMGWIDAKGEEYVSKISYATAQMMANAALQQGR
jgi:hypothetical protein